MAMEQLLELLQDQANLTPAQLAVMLGEQEEDVVKAIKKYEKEGVIKGYHALVNWERTEVPRATALIELRVSPQKDTGFDEIAGRVMNFPEVESAGAVHRDSLRADQVQGRRRGLCRGIMRKLTREGAICVIDYENLVNRSVKRIKPSGIRKFFDIAQRNGRRDLPFCGRA